MSDEYERSLDPRRQQAVTELRGMIARRYPTAAFDIGPGEEDPQVTHLTTSVDLDDPDEVADLVMERMLALQLDEGIPVYVHPHPDTRAGRQAAARTRAPEHIGSTGILPPSGVGPRPPFQVRT